jgi:signal transduction histidine kinase
LEYLQNLHIASQTVSAIAHEINQPLAAISMYGEVALRSLDSDEVDLPKLKRAIKGCIEQSQRAGSSLHELLNFLHIGESKAEPFDLNHIVHDAISLVQEDGFGGFLHILELEHGLPAVLGNRTQIGKVLVNLIRNGTEAMHGAGLPLGSINITVKSLAETNMAQVTVQDGGPGFDAEASKRVFEPFFTTKSNGIGLGLSISRSMVEANGGKLWVEPNAKHGVTIHFTLPFAA